MSHPSKLRRVSNPPNPWHSQHVEWLEEPPEAEVKVFLDASRSVLSKNQSPDLPFTWSVNPYRGCQHGCAYCYARPSHEHLDFGAGTDFDRSLLVKPRVAELLAEAFERPAWKGELCLMSGNTDPYQPLEAAWGLTRACLEVCHRYRNPVGLITKSCLIERDLELIARLHRDAYCTVTVSIPFHDPERARAIEPGAPAPSRRMKTVRRLAEAGIPVGVNVAPIIPGLNDEDVGRLFAEAREAGARWVGTILVRLPGPVAGIFEERLRHAFPDRADRVLSQIQECRGGEKTDSRFGHRMLGQGPRWEAVAQWIDALRVRLGLEGAPPPPDPTTFRRPSRGAQLAFAL